MKKMSTEKTQSDNTKSEKDAVLSALFKKNKAREGGADGGATSGDLGKALIR